MLFLKFKCLASAAGLLSIRVSGNRETGGIYVHLSFLSLSISSQSVWFPRTVMPLVWCTPLWGTEDTYRWHMVNIQHFKIDVYLNG